MRSRRRARGRPRGTVPACAALAALLAAAAPAAADDTEPIRITVSAPAGCADTDGFVAEVTARTARARLAAPGEPARSFTVTITAAGKKARGTLVIDDPHGPGGTREMKGDSCAEVASALALVTALAIDPRASTAAKPPPPPPRPPPPPPKPVELPRDPKRLPFAPLPWWGPIGAPLPVPPGTAPSPRWRIAAALQVGAAGAIAPGLSLTLSGSVDVARLGPGVLAPSFRLSFLTADSGDLTVDLPAGSPGPGPLVAPHAHLRWAAGRLEACPVRLPIVGPLTASPCAFFEAGAIAATGTAFHAPPPVTRPWAAPGLLGRLQLAVVEGLFFEVQGGALFPLIRDTFTFTDPLGMGGDATAHAVPAAGGLVSGGVGMHFP